MCGIETNDRQLGFLGSFERFVPRLKDANNAALCLYVLDGRTGLVFVFSFPEWKRKRIERVACLLACFGTRWLGFCFLGQSRGYC